MDNKRNLIALIKKNFKPPYVDILSSNIKSAIRLKTKSIKAEELGLGVSKFGGLPDLPSPIEWPQNLNSNPFLFVGQIVAFPFLGPALK